MTLPGPSGIADAGSVICRSEPQMPQFFTLRMRSCGPQTGSGTVSITSGFDISLKTAARMVRSRISHWTGLEGGYVIRGNEKTGLRMNPYATAHEILRDLESRRVSARELLKFEVARNEKLAKTLNAVIATDIPRALKDADAIDAARKRGEKLGPLAGLPMTIKDGLDVENMPASSGNPALKNRP